MIAAMPSSTSLADCARAWPTTMTITPANAATEPSDRAPADPLVEEQGREQQRDQRRDEGQRDRLRERHPADPPEEQRGHDRHDDAAR